MLNNFINEDATIQLLIRWAEGQPLVRAMILTSTRALPNAPADLFSDYDVILVLRDILPFHQDRSWLEAFGRVLVMYRDPLIPAYGTLTSGNVVQFEDGLKIDFSLWPVEVLQRIAAEPHLPAEFDAGYRVLLDKDRLTEGLKPPTYRAYIPSPPTEEQFVEGIEDFLLQAIYVAKLLWRDDLVAAKYILDGMMKQEHLIPMLEWHIETRQEWSVKTDPYGRGLKKWLRADLWEDLIATYTGAEPEANWEALNKSIALMRKASLEVGARLGYVYPHEMERRTLAYINRVKKLDRSAEHFS